MARGPKTGNVLSSLHLSLPVPPSASQRPDLLDQGEQKGGGQPEEKHPVQRLKSTHHLPLLITDRALKPGSQLPTEANLASELYVSRTTIRNALKFLEQEGKIERTPGRGTIVRQHRMG